MRLRADRWLEAGYAVLAASVAEVVALLVYRPWRALNVPFDYSGDANQYLMAIKGVIDHGWYERNPSVGAPQGQQLYDYPSLNGDDLSIVVIKLLGYLFGDAASAINVFFLLTFPLAAVAAYLVFRRLSVSREAALCCSVLFAVAPYHFLRGEAHLFLAAYYAVPIGAYLALAVLDGRALFVPRARALATVALCVVVALASGAFYYSAFTVLLLVVAALVRLVVARNPRAVIPAGICIAIIGVTSLLVLAPAFAYRLDHGPNPVVGQRFTFESETYSVKLAQLVLPPDTHRIGALARARREYNEFSNPLDARPAALGIVATAGFVWLLALALASIAAAGRRLSAPLHRHAALLALAAFLVATTGGVSVLIATVWPQIRSWNRLSIFIAFVSLLAVGLLIDALRHRLGRLVGLAAIGLVLGIGLFDQTSPAYTPLRDVEAEYRADAAFVGTIEDRLPSGAMVFQLPHVGFPEVAPPARMGPYDPVRGYLHSERLRWSYGAIRGRPEDWAAALAAAPTTEIVSAARTQRFRGIYVDRFGYEDGARAVEQALTAELGSPLLSSTERYSFFDLR